MGKGDFEIWYFSVTYLAKKTIFLVLKRKNEISPLWLPPSVRSLWLLLEKSSNDLSLMKILPTPMFLITVYFGANSSRSRLFQIYCRIGWQVTSDESWNTFRLCTSRTLITWRNWFLTRRKGNVKSNIIAPHNCDWSVLINSIYGLIAQKKTLKLDRFLARIWASRHAKYISPPHFRA